MRYDPVEVARQFLYVREAQSIGQNRGIRVEAIQHWSGGNLADSWCLEFVWFVLDIASGGQPPFDRMQACQSLYDLAKAKAWVTSTPSVGDLFLYVNDQGRAHHVGFVSSTSPLVGLAGNTSSDGQSSNGDGVYEHPISAHVFVHYPR